MAPARTQPYAPGRPAWVDLGTPDPEGARLFYGALLGWKFDVGPPDTGNYTTCRMQGRIVAGMQGQPAPEGEPHAWTVHLATDDAGATAERVLANGGAVVLGPMNVMEEGRMLFADDPLGARFGAWEAGTHVGAELVDAPGAVTWTEVATTDLDSATAFYSAVFGHAWDPMDTGESGPRYATFLVDGQPAGGALEVLPHMPEMRPQWRTYFAVADADAAARSVERLGGQVLVGPRDSPYGRVADVLDPQGVPFSIIGPRSG